VTQGALFTDPRAGVVKFGDVRKEFMTRLDVTDTTVKQYESNYRGSGAAKMLDHLSVSAVARMDTEVEDLLNGPKNIKKMHDYRVNVLRIVRGTLDRAVRRHVIPGHLFADVKLKTYRPTAEEYAERNAPWVFVTDAQARALAEGVRYTVRDKRGREYRRTHQGIGVAVWLMRCCGARIGEALGAETADFTELDDGSRVWMLRWQAHDDGKSLVALKHRPGGEGRDIPVPDFVWNMVKALPEGPVCPGVRGKGRYLRYQTATVRLYAVAEEIGIGDGWHAHNLRHQFASEEAASGANIADLAETLGHQSPEVTFRRYVRSMPGRVGRMAARMNDRWAIAA
jgi:integrase